MVFCMYFPVVMATLLSSGIRAFSGPETPIGKAEFGGRLRGTTGTGFSRFRVYGMYALVYLLAGGGRYRDRRGTDRRLEPGDLVVVFPEHAHQYGPEGGDDWDEVFVAFKGAAFDGWRMRGLDPMMPVWKLSNPAEWESRFARLLRQPSGDLEQSTVLATEIHQMIAAALAQRTTGCQGWLESAMQWLGGGSSAPSLREIAAMSGMSHDHFRKVFKSATGESPSEFRRRRRLSQAAMMLQRADLTLDLIAESLGFCDGFHLSKAFKAEFGNSPEAYRRALQSKHASLLAPDPHHVG